MTTLALIPAMNISATIFINNDFRGVTERFSINYYGPSDADSIMLVSKCAIAQRNADTDAVKAKTTKNEADFALEALNQINASLVSEAAIELAAQYLTNATIVATEAKATSSDDKIADKLTISELKLNTISTMRNAIMTRATAEIAAKNATETAKIAKAIKDTTTATFSFVDSDTAIAIGTNATTATT